MADEKVYLDVKKLKRYLKKNNLNYSQASAKCGRNQATFSQIIRAGYTTKTFYTFMCRVFEVPYEKFLLTEESTQDTKEPSKATSVSGKIVFNKEKIKEYFAEKEISIEEAAEQFGFTSMYFSQMLDSGEMPYVTYQLICKLLNVKEEQFLDVPKPGKPKEAPGNTEAMQQVLIMQQNMERMITEQTKEIQSVKDTLKMLSSDVTTIGNLIAGLVTSGKESKDILDIITGLLKEIREAEQVHTDQAQETEKPQELSKEAEFVKNMMASKGYAYEEDILRSAAEKGMDEKAVLKAKKELNVVLSFSGYGKNQKKIWRHEK